MPCPSLLAVSPQLLSHEPILSETCGYRDLQLPAISLLQFGCIIRIEAGT